METESQDTLLSQESEVYVPSLEDFAPSPRKPKGLFQRWPATGKAFVPLLLFASFGIVSFLSWTHVIPSQWVSGADLTPLGEPWRLFTALFMHADEGHLFSNGILFLVFGWLLRSYFGVWAFPILPLIAGVLTNIIVVANYPPDVRLMGASGMVYAMVAMWLVYYFRFETDRRFSLKILRVVGFSLLMMFPQTYDPKVSYLAHSAGFVSGSVIAFISLPFMTLKDPR